MKIFTMTRFNDAPTCRILKSARTYCTAGQDCVCYDVTGNKLGAEMSP